MKKLKIVFAYNVKHKKPTLKLKDESDLDFDLPKTISLIIKTIRSLGHEVTRLEADENAFSKLKNLKKNKKVDLIFNIAEGLRGDARESQIPIFCEILKIPYTHSSPTTHAISLNKAYTKLLLRGVGIRVPGSVVSVLGKKKISNKVKTTLNGLTFPLILKPNSEGSSIGVFDKNVVDSISQLEKRVAEFEKEHFEGELLAEEYIDGREFTVGILGNFGGSTVLKNFKVGEEDGRLKADVPLVFPIIEQKFDFLPKGMHKIAGFELKWIYEDNLKDLKEAYDCPAKIDHRLQKRIKEASLLIYKTLEVKDCARIDYRLDKKGNLYFIEINTLPGINPDTKVISYFPLAARVAGVEFEEVVKRIINGASTRYRLSNL